MDDDNVFELTQTEEHDGLLLENDFYCVLIEEALVDPDFPDCMTKFNGVFYDFYYIVQNKGTGVTEFKTPSLPSAAHAATQLNMELKKQPWKWMEEDGEMDETDTFLSDMEEITKGLPN